MTKTTLLLLGSAALAVGCHRAEGVSQPDPVSTGHAPTSTPTSDSTPQVTSTAPPRVQIEAASCVVPWSSSPPTEAKPAATCPTAPDVAVPLNHGRVTFVDAPGAPSVDVELAQSPEDQQRGLMYRTSMSTDAGMLFSWTGDRIRTFWMHNTCLPLDMLFIARDGTISGILEQVPVLNDEPRSVGCPAAHVLEVNAGYSRKKGIAPGQHVRISTS
ncbi:MAG: DUF192 domain-containing protein [Polyangiaceae bacterium]